VYIEDSTIIVLPAALRDLWHGCGSASEQGEAAIKLTLRLNLASGRLAGLSLHDGRVHDSRAAHPVTSLPPESLYLADLGFFRLSRLHQIDAQGGFFLSRLQAQTTVFDPMAGAGTTWRPCWRPKLLRSICRSGWACSSGCRFDCLQCACRKK
jgi:hypothetical protein